MFSKARLSINGFGTHGRDLGILFVRNHHFPIAYSSVCLALVRQQVGNFKGNRFLQQSSQQ
jgi:hypothetical protein